jgi:hypothetical protein
LGGKPRCSVGRAAIGAGFASGRFVAGWLYGIGSSVALMLGSQGIESISGVGTDIIVLGLKAANVADQGSIGGGMIDDASPTSLGPPGCGAEYPSQHSPL